MSCKATSRSRERQITYGNFADIIASVTKTARGVCQFDVTIASHEAHDWFEC